MADLHFRYRRIIEAYRAKLLEIDERACTAVDIQVEDWGEGWVTREYVPNLDRFMTAREIAEEFGFSVQNIKDWARRHPNRISKFKDGGATRYLLREVLTYWSRRKL